MKKAVIVACAGLAAGERQIELLSSDLSGGSKVLDNVRGRWSQSLKFLGAEAKLEAEYDRKARQDFLKEASLSGKVDDVSYELKTGFGDTTELKLATDTTDGTAIEVLADSKNGLTKLTAGRDVKIQGRGCNLEASHERQSSTSKVTLSSVLGHGLSGKATWKVGDDLKSSDMELQYASSVSDGRDVKATLNPKDGSGDIEYVDTKSLDATITASMDTGGKPKLTLKRAWNF